ncbi:MAG: MgtC/SapB family protein [Duganella sp.]
MMAIAHYNPSALLDTLVSLATAFVLGTMIGLERQVRQRTAGLRTNTLVAVGAAIFVSLGVRLAEAALAAVFVLASNTLLRPVVNRINRNPLREEHSEATYKVYVVCSKAGQANAREQMQTMLEAADYPVREVVQHSFGQNEVEIEATLYATAVQPPELDVVMERLERIEDIRQAFWSAGAGA